MNYLANQTINTKAKAKEGKERRNSKKEAILTYQYVEEFKISIKQNYQGNDIKAAKLI